MEIRMEKRCACLGETHKCFAGRELVSEKFSGWLLGVRYATTCAVYVEEYDDCGLPVVQQV